METFIPFISVIVPVYNPGEYLYECLDSILKQTYKNIEVIIVDDGSTDFSGKICDQYAQADERIKVFHQENHGLVASRKKALSYCRGEYIGFVDSDDWIEETMYEELIRLLRSNDLTDIICFGSNHVREGKTGAYLNLIKEGEYTGENLCTLYKSMMFDDKRNAPGIFQSACCKLFRKSLLEKILVGMDDRLTYGEDAAIVYSCCLKAGKIVITNYKFYNYRANDNSMSRGKNVKIFEKTNLFYEYMMDVFSKYPQEWDLARQLKCYILYFIQIGLSRVFGIECKKVYQLPFDMIRNGEKIVLYGAGDVGTAYYQQLKNQKMYEIVRWVDLKCAGKMIQGRIIDPVDVIKDVVFDTIIIAVKKENVMVEIKKQLEDMGIDSEKVVWTEPIEKELQWQLVL